MKSAKEVFVLGAGFSKAVYAGMPLMREMNDLTRRFDLVSLDSTVNDLLTENFEQALSYLAENKPWMEPIEAQKHQLLLENLSRNIGYAIRQAQRWALDQIREGQYKWLLPLIDLWHRSEASVVTLNYDVLVEALAAYALGGYQFGSEMAICQRLYPKVLVPAHIRSGLGTWADYSAGMKTFRLLKLHGSVNWHYSGRPDNQGESIYITAPSSVPEAPLGDGPEEVLDKIPFIVPPVPSKGRLASHESIRAMWRAACIALQHAERLVIVGYSMPKEDLLLVQMLRTKFPKGLRIDVIDIEPNHFQHIKDTLHRVENVEQRFSGANCVRDFVATLPEPSSELVLKAVK